jgi:hypothetical protein
MSNRVQRTTRKLTEKCSSLQKQLDMRDASKQRPVLEKKLSEANARNEALAHANAALTAEVAALKAERAEAAKANGAGVKC